MLFSWEPWKSCKQHMKLHGSNVDEEQRITGIRGMVRAKDRWGMCSAFAHIRGIAFLLPA